MVNSRIIIEGVIDKEPKVGEDGTVNLILSNEIDNVSSKNIVNSGKSIFLLKCTKKQWHLIKDDIKKPNTKIWASGRVKVCVNKKGIPYLYIYPDSINVYKREKKIRTNFKGLSIRVNDAEKKYIPWRQQVNDTDFIDLEPSKVELVEEDHINTKFNWLDLEKGRSYTELIIAVRKIDDDKYTLVSGIARFIIGKTFNRPFKAYVTDLTRDEFTEEFEIKKENKDL